MNTYTHTKLGEEIRSQAGYYIPVREVSLPYRECEVLYVVGQAVIESSCCGTGSFRYITVPGYIVRWQERQNEAGLPISEVEPITAKASQDEIRTTIIEREQITHIEFL